MTTIHPLGPDLSLWESDCRNALRVMPDNFLDSCVTDPPYALVSIVKRFGSPTAAPAKGNDAYMRASAGFMGKTWDTGEVAMSAEFWADVLRVLKPGAHVVAFGASRGYHRMACAIEDAGFEIRDSLMWIYGTGFPKSHNMDGEHEGWGTALKPAFEPVVLARKPLSEKTVAENVLKWRTGAINIDGTRIESEPVRKNTAGGIGYHGGDAIEQGTGTLMHSQGRWPANVVHDGSAEVVEGFPNTKTGGSPANHPKGKYKNHGMFSKGGMSSVTEVSHAGDSGSAARFFYSAKASKADRAESKHPTVKPIALMQWLARLVTPPGGVVLDPFAGSGTTGAACALEGFRCIMVEREAEYIADIKRRFSC